MPLVLSHKDLLPSQSIPSVQCICRLTMKAMDQYKYRKMGLALPFSFRFRRYLWEQGCQVQKTLQQFLR